MEYADDNKVRIADKDIRTYLGQCDKKLHKYPEIVLSFGETFAEKGRTIVSILGAIGIKVHKSNLNKFSGIRFGKNESNILNRKTGLRENKAFYEIVLTKIKDLNIDDTKKREFADIKDAKITKEQDIANELKISDNSLDFYLGQCNLDFQSHDQLVLSTTAENIELVRYMTLLLNPLGIEIDEDYIENDKVYFHAAERERINPKSGRKERKVFYRLGITKVPELFMYTNPKEAIEYPRED